VRRGIVEDPAPAPVPLPPPAQVLAPHSSAHAVRFGSGLDFSAIHRNNYSVLGSSMAGGRQITAERVREQQYRHYGFPAGPASSNGSSSLPGSEKGSIRRAVAEWPPKPRADDEDGEGSV
jgi:hypothetical protein